MSGSDSKINLQEKIINLTYYWGSPLSALSLTEFESKLYAELSSLEKQDSIYESGRGLETIPHLLDVGELVNFYLSNSNFLTQEYFSEGSMSKSDWHRAILLGAYLHDIGKNHLDAKLLGRRGKLNSEELRQIKTHVSSSIKELKEMRFAEPVYNIVLYHHERIDGSGYPEGLREEQIPVEVIPVAFFDTLHAISTRRYFGRDFSPETAEEAVHYASRTLGERFPHGLIKFAENNPGVCHLLNGMMRRARNKDPENYLAGYGSHDFGFSSF